MDIKCANCQHFRGYKESYLKERQTRVDELAALRKHKNWFVRVFCSPSQSQIDWANFHLKDAQDMGRCVLNPKWEEVAKKSHHCSKFLAVQEEDNGK